MKQEDQVLDPRQQEAMRGLQPNADLWSRIEVQAKAKSAQGKATTSSEAAFPGGPSQFANALRLMAAGVMGFVSFFALQWMLVPDAVDGGRPSLSAGGYPNAERIREDIPLMGDSDLYVDSLQQQAPWPEVTLATSFAPSESN